MYFIAKTIFTMMFWVVLARWGYAEVSRVSPQLAGSLDQVMELATIPTHDQWDLTTVKEIGNNIAEHFQVEEAFAEQE